MSTVKAYRIRAVPHGLSDSSDATVRGIRSALIDRGTTLHAWALQWAHAHGRDPHATYVLILQTLRRRVAKGLPVTGRLGARMVGDLMRDLGHTEDLEAA